jgi:hypothetical protein
LTFYDLRIKWNYKSPVFKLILLYGCRKYAVVENEYFIEKYAILKYKLCSRTGTTI